MPNLDQAYQPRIATHPSSLVRLILLERSDLIDPVRGVLLRDSDETVLKMAAARLAETSTYDLYKLLYKDTPELLFALAGNEGMHPEGLKHLCGHPDPAIAKRAEETLLTIARIRQHAARGAPRAS